MGAVPVHHTATDDSEWDGPAQEKKLKAPLTAEIGNDAYAWVDPDADATTKSAWKFIHHFVSRSGRPGAASTLACSTGVAVLNGARSGTTIPESDRKGVYEHLVAHLKDAGVEVDHLPELKSLSAVRSERRSAPKPLNLVGYASTTEKPYDMGPYDETVARGAFGKTLAENPDVQLTVNHGGLPLARTVSGTMRLSEDRTGLLVDADLDPEDPDVQAVARKIQRGDIDQMSFAFKVTRQAWDDTYTERRILEADLHRGDVSICNQGANPTTSVAVRAATLRAAGRSSRKDRKEIADAVGSLAVVEVRGFRLNGTTYTLRDVELDSDSLCNRCGGDGVVALTDGAGKVTCPLCKGTGTGENNADLTDGDGSKQQTNTQVSLAAARVSADARAKLEALRYPPGHPSRSDSDPSGRERLEALREPPPRGVGWSR